MISNNELTLSSKNRYFLHTPVQCKDEKGNLQKQSVLIDNITDNSMWDMNTQKLKCSLLQTSPQYKTINQINASQKGESLPSAETEMCRNVSVYADENKSKIISGYISLDDYKNVSTNAIAKSPGSSPVLSPGSSLGLSQSLSPSATTENFSTLDFHNMQYEPSFLSKIKNNSILRFYFVSLLIIAFYIIFRLFQKLQR